MICIQELKRKRERRRTIRNATLSGIYVLGIILGLKSVMAVSSSDFWMTGGITITKLFLGAMHLGLVTYFFFKFMKYSGLLNNLSQN